MGHFLGKGMCFRDSPQGLVWIAKIPQAPSRIAPTHDPKILHVPPDRGRMLLRIIQCKVLLQVSKGSGKVSHEMQDLAKGMVRFHQESRVLDSLRQAHELLCYPMRRL